jgi:long-subunit fatty acid transport protein
MRHAKMPLEYTGRFQGQSLDLRTSRVELQAGWSANPNWAFGASLGITRIHYSWDNMVRSTVAVPGQPSITGLMESDLRQEGSRIAPSYSMGFRWAANSRWTVGGAYVGSISTTLPLTASNGSAVRYFASSGYGPAPTGISAVATALAPQPGDGRITLPGKATLGVRQRVNKSFTWEFDLRYVLGASTRIPGVPYAVSGGSIVRGPGDAGGYRNGFGMNLMGELAFGRRWVVRLGAELDPALRTDAQVDPLVGGAKSSGFSGGFGYRMFGGELNFGYQYRQSQDVDNRNLNGSWTSAGYAAQPLSSTRVEGMGHLWSLGFKRTF